MWNTEKTAALYDLVVKQKLNYREAASKLGTSPASCKRKFARVNWKEFHRVQKNPDTILLDAKQGEWADEELILLHSLRKESRPPLSYLDISKRINRTPTACERKFQTTDWVKFMNRFKKTSAISSTNSEKDSGSGFLSTKNLKKNLGIILAELSRWNISRLESITRHDFLKKVRMTESQLPCKFPELVKIARQELDALGYNYPEDLHLQAGTYVVVGDSHGKHTKRGMFRLLKQVSQYVKANNVIHIGHALDDDGDISFCWEDIDNLIVLARREELQTLMSFKHSYNIARSRVYLGRLSLANQDFITDYSLSFIGNLKRNHFEDSTIVNSHRQELATRTTGGGDRLRSQIASPGCLCEPHIIKTIRQIDFQEGRQIKISYPDSHVKYHKMDDISRRNWENGLVIVKVDENGNFDFIQCRIYSTSKGYATSFFNKIITENGVVEPEKRIFFNGDAHCQSHDHRVFDIQEAFCKDYRPDIVVNLGDLLDNRSCNHHLMERNGFAISSDILDEMASAHHILKRMTSWGKECHLLCGNHERFARDIAERFPQFSKIFDVGFMVGAKSLGFNLTDYKQILQIGSVLFSHGDMKMFGAKGGSKVEKAFNTFGRNSIIGHLHTPTIRNGCYIVGLSGELNQDYNEPEASSWMHGFGYVNFFEGHSFISLVNIRNHRTWINGRYYTSKNPSNWTTPKYEANITFSFE